MRAISEGKVANKSKKLYRIECMEIGIETSHDNQKWSLEIKKYYEEKWAKIEATGSSQHS